MNLDNPENGVQSKTIFYFCPKCKKTHYIKLSEEVKKGKSSFPFPYAYLHSSEGELNDLLTILYLDNELMVRGVNIIEIKDSLGIFSEEFTKQIIEKLMENISNLQQENVQLRELLGKIEVQESSGLKLEIPQEAAVVSNLEEVMDVEEEVTIQEFQNEPEKKPYKKKLITLKTKTPGTIKHKTPLSQQGEKTISIFITSTIGPGEKKQKLSIITSQSVLGIKKTIGLIYGFSLDSFHLSLDGVTMDESAQINQYGVTDGDQVLLIPSSTAG